MLLDAPSFAAPPLLTDAGELDWDEIRFSHEAETLRGILAEVGVDTQIVHADMPLALRPPTGQVRRWEFKVLATGRALAVSTPWGGQG
jgi:hypothetical protein